MWLYHVIHSWQIGILVLVVMVLVWHQHICPLYSMLANHCTWQHRQIYIGIILFWNFTFKIVYYFSCTLIFLLFAFFQRLLSSCSLCNLQPFSPSLFTSSQPATKICFNTRSNIFCFIFCCPASSSTTCSSSSYFQSIINHSCCALCCCTQLLSPSSCSSSAIFSQSTYCCPASFSIYSTFS